jgi:hypothetical protein
MPDSDRQEKSAITYGPINKDVGPFMSSSAEVVAGLNPRLHQSETSIDRVTHIFKIGNAILRFVLPYNPPIVALVYQLKSRGRLSPMQIVCDAQAVGAGRCVTPSYRQPQSPRPRLRAARPPSKRSIVGTAGVERPKMYPLAHPVAGDEPIFE